MGSTDSSLEVAFLDVNNLNGCSSYLIIKPSAGESSARAIKIYAKENDMIISPWKRKGARRYCGGPSRGNISAIRF